MIDEMKATNTTKYHTTLDPPIEGRMCVKPLIREADSKEIQKPKTHTHLPTPSRKPNPDAAAGTRNALSLSLSSLILAIIIPPALSMVRRSPSPVRLRMREKVENVASCVCLLSSHVASGKRVSVRLMSQKGKSRNVMLQWNQILTHSNEAESDRERGEADSWHTLNTHTNTRETLTDIWRLMKPNKQAGRFRHFERIRNASSS